MEEKGVIMLVAAGLMALFVALVPQRTVRASEVVATPMTAATKPPDPGKEPTRRTGLELLQRLLDDESGAHECAYALDVVVATIPDPTDARLDTSFDSYLDALRRAFESTGYVAVDTWLPWASRTTGAVRTGDPGVMLFQSTRRSSGAPQQLRLLYLVNETPTRGVDREALRVALGEREVLCGRDHAFVPDGDPTAPVRIIGPVFSGSAGSLGGALEEWRKQHRECVRVVTGSATAATNAGEFASRDLIFWSMVHCDQTLLATFDEVRGKLGIEDTQVALVSESTTAYGQLASKGKQCSQPYSVSFPMSIASLRAAHALLPRRDVEPKLPAGIPDVSHFMSIDNLPLELRGNLGNDGLAITSPLTPPAQDLMLGEIARSLAARQIRAVGLIATDIRDKLFLADQLQKRCPDALLFTTEGNALYRHRDFNVAMRGTIVLSSYPLLVGDPGWVPGAVDRHLQTFASEGAQGVYNATLVQLGKDESVLGFGPPIPEVWSGQERGEARRWGGLVPPVWVTLVGRDEMVPLMAVDMSRRSTPFVVRLPIEAAEGDAHDGSLPFLPFALTVAVGIAILVYAHETLRRCRPSEIDWCARGIDAHLPIRIAQGAHPRVSGLRAERISLVLHHWLYTALGFVVLGGLLAPTTVLLWRSSCDPHARQLGLSVAAVAFAVLGLALTFVVRQALRIGVGFFRETLLFVRQRLRRRDDELWSWCLEFAARWAVFFGGILYAGCIGAIAWQMLQLARDDPTSFMLFAYRSRRIDQGLSPLLPLSFLGMILGLWCIWHLRRIRLLAEARPFEATLEHHVHRDSPLASHARTFRSCLFRVVPNGGLFLLLGLVALGCWLFLELGRTYEAVVFPHIVLGCSAFDLLLLGGILCAMGATVWAAYRLLRSWLVLQRALAALMDGGLDAIAVHLVPQSLGRKVSLGLWSPLSRLRIGIRRRELWDELRRLIPAAAAAAVPGAAHAIEGPTATLQPFRAARQYAHRLSIVETMARAAIPAQEPAAPGETAPAWMTRAAELRALEGVDWVEWAIRHLRHLALFLVLSLVLTTMMLASYPFAPQTLLGTLFGVSLTAAVAVLAFVILRMNRNETLSTLGGTEPGKLTWDRSLLVNLAGFVLIPILTLLGSSFPDLSHSLFAWMSPFVGAAVPG